MAMCLAIAAALGAAALMFLLVVVVLAAVAEPMEPAGLSPVGSARATLPQPFHLWRGERFRKAREDAERAARRALASRITLP